DPRALVERRALGNREVAPADSRWRIEDLRPDELDTARMVRRDRSFHDRRGIWDLERVERHHRLDDDVGRRIAGERAPVGGEGGVAGLVQRLTGADPLDAQAR